MRLRNVYNVSDVYAKSVAKEPSRRKAFFSDEGGRLRRILKSCSFFPRNSQFEAVPFMNSAAC
jgi:hypothetical protein